MYYESSHKNTDFYGSGTASANDSSKVGIIIQLLDVIRCNYFEDEYLGPMAKTVYFESVSYKDTMYEG